MAEHQAIREQLPSLASSSSNRLFPADPQAMSIFDPHASPGGPRRQRLNVSEKLQPGCALSRSVAIPDLKPLALAFSSPIVVVCVLRILSYDYEASAPRHPGRHDMYMIHISSIHTLGWGLILIIVSLGSRSIHAGPAASEKPLQSNGGYLDPHGGFSPKKPSTSLNVAFTYYSG